MIRYRHNDEVHPTGWEPAEFLELPSMADRNGHGVHSATTDIDNQEGPAVATKDYMGQGIAVHWDSDRCIHSGRCWSGAPDVFVPAARPWVNLDGAFADHVAAVIDTCPTGALSYTRTDGARNGRRGWTSNGDQATAIAADPVVDTGDGRDGEVEPATATITPLQDGPLSVEGAVGLTRPDRTVRAARRLSLCRCGQSAAKPHCDGSHERVGFTAPGVPT